MVKYKVLLLNVYNLIVSLSDSLLGLFYYG